MTDEELKAAWDSAKDLGYWVQYKKRWAVTEHIDTKMDTYGDWYLYRDKETGEYYAEYMSIGD